MYAGVDEAGRGPVLGPLVVAGVTADPSTLPEGIADSKALSPARRAALFDAILAVPGLRHAIVTLEADELNRRMGAESLNVIETAAFLEVLTRLGATRAVVDTIGARPDRFGLQLTEAMGGRCEVEARVGADTSDPVVGAASILAKVTRDRAIEVIAASLGEPIGSGYPHDPRTRAFLASWRERTHLPPPHTRTRWSTLAAFGFGTRRLDTFHPEGDRP